MRWLHTPFMFWLVVLLRASEASSPVIGILAQPVHDKPSELYIAASYVKWLEAGGARSIAIPYDETDSSILDDLFSQVDAIFLPGGATPLRSFSVDYMLAKAVERNNDSYFPVWGTCLGFEYLVQFIAGSENILHSGFESENVSLPLQSVLPASLYKDDRIYDIVTRQNVTLNNHKMGLSPESFYKNSRLQSVWQVTSLNRDGKGQLFVSSLEPIGELPFYAVQFHPEKNAFEYATYPGTDIPYEAIDHSKDGIIFSLSLSRFVVDLARKSQGHSYTQPSRFPYVYSYPQRVGLKFEQVYIIPAKVSSKKSHLRSPIINTGNSLE